MTRIRITRVTDDASIARQLVPHMERFGQAVGARMQRLVPKKSWSLHDTISAETEQAGAKVITQVGFGGGKVKYGLHVERGTSRARAQPFARPALAQSKTSDLKYSGTGIMTHGAKVEAADAKKASARERRNERARANYIGSANQ